MNFIEYFSSFLSEPISFKVDTANVDKNMQVFWSWSTTNCGIFYGNNGTWTLVYYPIINPSHSLHPPLQTKVWQDDICSPSHFAFGGCSDCHLVVKVVKHINQEDGTWAVVVVKLTDEPTDMVAVENLQFQFIPDPELLTSALFTVRSVSLHPSINVARSSQGPFCTRHKLFIQIGIGIVIQDLVCNKDLTFELSEISNSFCPEGYLWSDDGNPSCSNFVVSKENSLIALMPNEHLVNIWDIKDVVSYSHSIPTCNLGPKLLVNKICVVSVGQLYSVVCSVSVDSLTNVALVVLSTTTGRKVFETDIQLISVRDILSISTDIYLDELWTSNYSFRLLCVCCSSPFLWSIAM